MHVSRVYACVCVCTPCIYTHACVCAYMWMQKPEEDAGIFLQQSLPYFLEPGSCWPERSVSRLAVHPSSCLDHLPLSHRAGLQPHTDQLFMWALKVKLRCPGLLSRRSHHTKLSHHLWMEISYCMYLVRAFVGVKACCTCGGHSTACRSWSSLVHCVYRDGPWVIKCGSKLPLSHLTGPTW